MAAKTEESRYASRKFLLVAIVWAGGTVAWALKMMDAPTWVDFTKYMVALYMAGNVGSSLVDILKLKQTNDAG